MQPPTKRLGEMLVEAGLISAGQLQEALRYQRMAGGRMGSNLVQLGFVSEDVLMDFLAQQTGVPRLTPQALQQISPEVLKRVPQRLAEQLTVLPIAFKEPKSLVLAMADPSDLNAIDSTRFASGLNIEPVVASHSVLRKAIAEAYRIVDTKKGGAIEVGGLPSLDGGLPVSFNFETAALEPSRTAPVLGPPPFATGTGAFPKDPFFDAPAPPALDPFGLFAGGPPPADPAPPMEMPAVIPVRSAALGSVAAKLDTYQTRTLVMGLIKLLVRRGVLGDDELQRIIANLLETGELRDVP